MFDKLQIAKDVLEVKKYLETYDIEPLKISSQKKFSEKTNTWIYTWQSSFKSEKELDMFVKFSKLINTGLLDVLQK